MTQAKPRALSILLCVAVLGTTLLIFNEAHAYTLSVPFRTTRGGPGESIAGPAEYIARLYNFALAVGGLLAMAMIVIGAIQYTLSAGFVSRQQDARDRILNAIYGLGLLLSTYLILAMINPRLVGLSNVVLNPSPVPPPNTPNQPLNLRFEPTPPVFPPGTDYMLRWTDDSTNEDQFVVEGFNQTQQFQEFGRTPSMQGTGGEPTYPIPRIFHRTGTVQWRVRAANTSGMSNPSNSITLPPYVVPTVDAPTDLNITRANNVPTGLTWRDNSAYEDGFILFAIIGATGQRVEVTRDIPTNAQVYTFPPGMDLGPLRGFQMLAFRRGGVGEPALILSALTPEVRL